MDLPFFDRLLGSSASVCEPYHVRLCERKLTLRTRRCLSFEQVSAEQW